MKFFDLSISMVKVFIAKVSAISDVTTNLTDNMVIAFDVKKFFIDKWVGCIGWDTANIFGFFAITAANDTCFKWLNKLFLLSDIHQFVETTISSLSLNIMIVVVIVVVPGLNER